MNQRLEALATELSANNDYRVLRRLKARSKLDFAVGTPTHLGIMLDVETNGLDPSTDEVIELAMVPFLFTNEGHVVEVLPAFNDLRQPKRPIPPAIVKLTGITDTMVEGHTIDRDAVAAFISPAEWIIAFHSRFDRPFAERLCPGFAAKRWACAMAQIPWTEAGAGMKLAYLLNSFGLFHDGHRALDDCNATIEILARPLCDSGRTSLSFLLQAAEKATQRIWATGVPYEVKDKLRARSYRWNAGTGGRPRSWYIDVEEGQREAEVAFLRDEVFSANWHPTINAITALDRFSERV